MVLKKKFIQIRSLIDFTVQGMYAYRIRRSFPVKKEKKTYTHQPKLRLWSLRLPRKVLSLIFFGFWKYKQLNVTVVGQFGIASGNEIPSKSSVMPDDLIYHHSHTIQSDEAFNTMFDNILDGSHFEQNIGLYKLFFALIDGADCWICQKEFHWKHQLAELNFEYLMKN